MTWETVIGLEVHVQLATQSKLFSGASTQFGAPPNTQACAIDLAMPGILPVPNKKAFEYAVMFGLAINAKIGKRSYFERKNYFYPDLPKGYQTTQLDQPIVGSGYIDIEPEAGAPKRIKIHHAHLEEDAGKSLHEDFSGMSGIDLNRAGTPLIEVVSEPDMRSAAEAVAFAKKLHTIVTSLEICDGAMSQGSMRFDVNISVRRPGDPLGTRTETKNLNSYKFMEEAIELEVERQIQALENSKTIRQETRLYNGETRKARAMRSKEDSNDYRYFPCPDLLPVELDDHFIQRVKSQMPELPETKIRRFTGEYGLSDYDASILANDGATSRYFEAAVAALAKPKLIANWIMGELSAALNHEELNISQSKVGPESLAQLIERIDDGTLSSKTAKIVFDSLWKTQEGVDAIIESKGLKQVSDVSALKKIADDIIENNPKQVENFRKATSDKQAKMMGFFTGQAMKATQGKANPQQINAILLEKLQNN